MLGRWTPFVGPRAGRRGSPGRRVARGGPTRRWVITKLEEKLPIKVFAEEWRLLKRGDIPWWRGRYAEQGTVERVVPWVFAALYLFAIYRATAG